MAEILEGAFRKEAFQRIQVITKKSNDLVSEVPDHHFHHTASVNQITKLSLNSREEKMGLCLMQGNGMDV